MSISQSKGTTSRNLAIVKQYFKKPMMLVVAIFSIVTLITSFMWSSAVSKMSDEIKSAMSQLAEGENLEVSGSSGGSLGFLIAGAVALCFFMIYVFSLTPNGNPTIWFTILHIFSVIQLIANALAALIVFVFEIVFIFATPTLVQFVANSESSPFGEMTEEQMEAITRQVDSFRITLLIGMVITLIIYGIYLYYINSQTALLKSVTLTCKNPQLKSRGAIPYGNLSIAMAVIQLVGIIVFYLMVGNADTNVLNEMELDMPIDLTTFNSLVKPYLIYAVCNALYIFIRGYYAKGWEAFAKENEQYVYEAVGAGTRMSEASPMPTYKSTTRATTEARQQSQPYLIGEEENPNKKSSYIPEELQNDYNDPQQMYGQGDQYGGAPYGAPVGNPYGAATPGGNPYGAPYGGAPAGNPYGDPFAGDPFAQSPMNGPQGGNPYGGPGGYNNGMM